MKFVSCYKHHVRLKDCLGSFVFTIQFVIAALLAVAAAAPAKLDQEAAEPVAIVSSTSEMNADGSYSFA